MAVLLNKSDMASSLGISVQAFDKWGVQPVEKRGREVFFDVRSVVDNRIEHQSRKLQPSPGEDDDGVNIDYERWRLPLLYGRRQIGGAIISAGIYVEDQQ